VDSPETQFTWVGNDRVAYQVFGDGPVDLVYVMGTTQTIDLVWDWPPWAHYLRRLGSFTRVIMFDRRGQGASDRATGAGLAIWEHWADDIRAVMDAAGSERAAIYAASDSGPSAIFFAATTPDRTQALVLYCTTARFPFADDYPWGLSLEQIEAAHAYIVKAWGTEDMAAFAGPTVAQDPAYRRLSAKMTRAAYNSQDILPTLRTAISADVREILPTVRTPTLVISCRDFEFCPLEHGRYLAEQLPNARLLVLPGSDATDFFEPEERLQEMEMFLGGAPAHAANPDRVLAAVLFTDIVGSTDRAAALGDRRWKMLLDSHDTITRGVVEQCDGRLVKLTGDGVLATFDGPGRAVRCAVSLREALRTLAVEIRAGIHTGEVELREADISGIGVHVAARVMEHAGTGEVLVSGAVPLLMAGSGVEFESRGEWVLKGVPGEWPLFALKT
jgi:class 3 adenylate cyclase/predicted alpha/beta hydrolase